MNQPSPLAAPLTLSSIAGIRFNEIEVLRDFEVAGADGSYRKLTAFTFAQGATLNRGAPHLCIHPEAYCTIHPDGRAEHGYNPNKWVVSHRATGTSLSPAMPHFDDALRLARELETAANWERLTRGPSSRKPIDNLPEWQRGRIAQLIIETAKRLGLMP